MEVESGNFDQIVYTQYQQKVSKVVVREASEKVDVVPAKYEEALEKVLVS